MYGAEMRRYFSNEFVLIPGQGTFCPGEFVLIPGQGTFCPGKFVLIPGQSTCCPTMTQRTFYGIC